MAAKTQKVIKINHLGICRALVACPHEQAALVHIAAPCLITPPQPVADSLLDLLCIHAPPVVVLLEVEDLACRADLSNPEKIQNQKIVKQFGWD